jgi:hypothetical protein
MKIGTNGNNQAGTAAFLVAKLICASLPRSQAPVTRRADLRLPTGAVTPPRRRSRQRCSLIRLATQDPQPRSGGAAQPDEGYDRFTGPIMAMIQTAPMHDTPPQGLWLYVSTKRCDSRAR